MLANEYDSSGVYGGIFHYALVFAFVGSALLGFFYFWYKGCLNLGEEPKLQMMRDEEKREKDHE
jgi:hypothetical protein